VAEESGKGIALVILGIVAIIAIVGLVLLFTGAKKAAVGEFAVPGAKEYGGAIRGVYDPYSRSFSGRASDVANVAPGQFSQDSWYDLNDASGVYSGQGQTDVGQGLPRTGSFNQYGESVPASTVANTITYGRNFASTPGAQTYCQGIVWYNHDPSDDYMTENMDANHVANNGWTVMSDGRILDGQGNTAGRTLESIRNIEYRTTGFPLDDSYVPYQATGAFACTRIPDLGGLA